MFFLSRSCSARQRRAAEWGAPQIRYGWRLREGGGGNRKSGARVTNVDGPAIGACRRSIDSVLLLPLPERMIAGGEEKGKWKWETIEVKIEMIR